MQKVFVSSDHTITFKCPKCNEPKTVDVSSHENLEKAERVKVKCACGNIYFALIEKRKQFRRTTNFPGTFTHIVSDIPKDKGTMVVTDVSRTGLRIKINTKRDFFLGDKLMVEFHLDDKNKSLIKKECIIKKDFGLEFGIEFTSVHPSDPSYRAIGFYMF
ncbi:MAG: PilZ domain-containing protein [Deltaproteobacteria bacterium]|nr:PilZ domain-containing protein [Deltaproteobacteria bacterium]